MEDHGGGGAAEGVEVPNTSVLSLSAAITPNHKHGHVQICLRLERPPAEMFPDVRFLNARTRGSSASPRSDSNVHRGSRLHRHWWHKHVNHCGQLLVLLGGLCMRLKETISLLLFFFRMSDVLFPCCVHMSISLL